MRPPVTPLLDEPDEVPPVLVGPPVHPLIGRMQALVTEFVRAQADGALANGTLTDAAAALRAGESVQGLALVEVAAVERTRSYVAAGRASTAGWIGRS